MSNYEIIKECKIIYEYLNDIMTNSKKDISNAEYKSINNTLNTLGKLYNETYEIMKKEDNEVLKTELECPHCNNEIYISDLIDYAYLCTDCDENFYLTEGDLDLEWYFSNVEDKIKLDDDFLIYVNYDKEKGEVVIGTENSSGANYKCKTIKDLKNIVGMFANNYLENEISIQMWLTEEDRDMGESFIYDKVYYDANIAIKQARKIYENNNYACIEVVKNNKAIYNVDSESEDYYFNGKRISKVNSDVLNEYINNFSGHKNQTFSNNKLYCEENNEYIAVDNSSNNCFVESFNLEKDAINWLLGIEKKKELDNEL